ncbi:endogenous retrovirus group K member 5 Gag polyprotein-like isoform X1 [Leptotrombidium deliense]|uniref:Endogenous retrovirus group K member 5 Gag polyprotein-like isoform X1 n=1 Tax=Leptotrombidium deliense TaxID=299467 RepID=A0A443S571_9ACAR|nr:endogenous retrovirus group K member 5 Gag polyprotein-like isoform X1 [Leptotrombidium deliense]
MGSEVSRLRMEGPLRELLKVNGTPLKTKTARSFLKTVEEVSPWFLDEGLLDIPQWELLGEDLKDAEQGKPLPPGMLAIWDLIKSCLQNCKPSFKPPLSKGEAVLEEIKEERSCISAKDEGSSETEEEEELSGEELEKKFSKMNCGPIAHVHVVILEEALRPGKMLSIDLCSLC